MEGLGRLGALVSCSARCRWWGSSPVWNRSGRMRRSSTPAAHRLAIVGATSGTLGLLALLAGVLLPIQRRTISSRRDLLALAAAMPAFGGSPGRGCRCLRTATASAIAGAGRRASLGADQRTSSSSTEFTSTPGRYGASPLAGAAGHHPAHARLRADDRPGSRRHSRVQEEIERFLGAWPGSVAVLRNTTEAMNNAANGIALEPGDEMLSTTHEHIGGRCCWELLAKRRGVVYRTFEPLLDPRNDDELVRHGSRTSRRAPGCCRSPTCSSRPA